MEDSRTAHDVQMVGRIPAALPSTGCERLDWQRRAHWFSARANCEGAPKIENDHGGGYLELAQPS